MTLLSKQIVWYGAVVVGVIEIVRGLHAAWSLRARDGQRTRD